MRVEILRSIDEVQRFASQWESLPVANPFASWAFMRSGLALEGIQPFVMVVKGHDDRLLALAPFCLRKKAAGIRQLEGIWGYQSWYHDPWIADASMQTAVFDLLIETLTRHRREWDAIDLILTAERSAPLIARMQALGWGFTDRPSDRQSRVVDFPDGWETYHKSLIDRSRELRRVLRQFQGKLDQLPHRYVEADAENYRPMLEAAIHFSQGRFDPDHQNDRWYQALRDLADWSAPRGTLRAYGLEIDGRFAAINLFFLAGDVAYSTLQVYDPQYAALSIGHATNLRAYQQLAAAGIRRVDLGDGAMAWKDRVKTADAETVLVSIGVSFTGKTLLGWKRWVKPRVGRLTGQPAH